MHRDNNVLAIVNVFRDDSLDGCSFLFNRRRTLFALAFGVCSEAFGLSFIVSVAE
jgi:hypothetical protein